MMSEANARVNPTPVHPFVTPRRELGDFELSLGVAEDSRTMNQIIKAGAIRNANAVGHFVAGQFIAASASGEALDETTTHTTGIATVSNASRAIKAVKG